MDVLIVERDELIGSILTDALVGEGISAVVATDEQALMLLPDDAPQVVITGMNRGHKEDLGGLTLVAAMRHKWPGVCAIYLATLWPAHLARRSLAAGERFLTKPVHLGAMVQMVRELLKSGLCRQPGTIH
jgi:DNA-binding response OmpR family regulator